ncbi:MAG: DUF4466 family protein [Porphyromonadaceae bacterium]|nr:DUF4466 family protein [Porphyromonadaceae bacterium]
MKKKYFGYILMGLVAFFMACDEAEYTVPGAKTELQNDCIKRSIGPNVAGSEIEFVYAIAMGYNTGKITSAAVESSIAGASGTYLENRSFYTNFSGQDVPVTIGDPCITNGKRSEVIFSKDTVAAALRYYYEIPEEAKGKEVSFTFSSKSNTGESVSYKMGPYTISKMDMKLDLVLSDNNNMFLSIADMKVYNAAEAAANPSKMDLIYLYREIEGITFAHALAAPTASSDYLPDVTVPQGVNNATKFLKIYGLRDRQLARLQYGIYIDDIDFEKISFENATDYGLNMKVESGAWVETADGKYRAFVFVNKVDKSKKEMTVSIKRYTMK